MLEDAARWSAVFDAIVQAVITIDTDGTIGSVNPTCLQMFGYDDADELVGKNVRILMPKPDSERHDSYLKNHLETGKRKIIGIGREVTALRKDGTTFPVHLSVGRYEANGRTGFVGAIQDLSELRAAEHEAKTHRERLERMDRISLAGEMASGIAHEVSQPLSAIANYSRAVQHMLQSGEGDAAEALEKIRKQAQRAGDIVNRMRDFVSKHSAKPQPTSMPDTVEEVLSFAEMSPRGRRIRVHVTSESSLPLVLIDRVQLQQVVLNLLNNAVEASWDATDKGPEIWVRCLARKGYVLLEIEDRGSGIDEATEEHLFTPFFSGKRDGTGIGLAISRTIVEAHGGTIGFRRNEGDGVTFYVQLPEIRA